jgi:hypothetical protein
MIVRASSVVCEYCEMDCCIKCSGVDRIEAVDSRELPRVGDVTGPLEAAGSTRRDPALLSISTTTVAILSRTLRSTSLLVALLDNPVPFPVVRFDVLLTVNGHRWVDHGTLLFLRLPALAGTQQALN